jgi:hypothetical protein
MVPVTLAHASGASAVTWNDTLAAYAQADASTCVYGHTNGPYGENIAAIGGSGSLDLTSDFNMWANEAAQYNWNSPGYSDATGHFTQVRGACGLAEWFFSIVIVVPPRLSVVHSLLSPPALRPSGPSSISCPARRPIGPARKSGTRPGPAFG